MDCEIIRKYGKVNEGSTGHILRYRLQVLWSEGAMEGNGANRDGCLYWLLHSDAKIHMRLYRAVGSRTERPRNAF